MSSRKRAIRAAVLLAVCAASAGAQQRDRLAAVRYAVVSARALSDSLHAIATADSIRRAAFPVLRNYGGLEFRGDSTIMPPEFLPAFDSAFARASREARTVLGADADTMLRGIVITTRQDGALSAKDGRADVVALHVRGRRNPNHVLHANMPADITRPAYIAKSTREFDLDEMVTMFVQWYRDAAGARLPVAIVRWSSWQFPIRESGHGLFESAYVQLARSRPSLWRACVGGARASCRAALALAPNNDTISAWYTAAEERALVALAYRQHVYMSPTHNTWVNGLYGLMRQCIEEYADKACHDAIERGDIYFWGRNFFESPTDAWSRSDLLRRALVHGGPGSYHRLVSATANDPASILETTAGGPIDSLVDGWRADLLEARPPSPLPTPLELFSSVLLGGLLVGAAVGRRP